MEGMSTSTSKIDTATLVANYQLLTDEDVKQSAYPQLRPGWYKAVVQQVAGDLRETCDTYTQGVLFNPLDVNDIPREPGIWASIWMPFQNPAKSAERFDADKARSGAARYLHAVNPQEYKTAPSIKLREFTDDDGTVYQKADLIALRRERLNKAASEIVRRVDDKQAFIGETCYILVAEKNGYRNVVAFAAQLPADAVQITENFVG